MAGEDLSVEEGTLYHTHLLPVTSSLNKVKYNSTDGTATSKTTSNREQHNRDNKSELFGYFLVTLSCFAYASNVICVRIAESKYGMHPFSVVFILSIVVSTLALMYLSIFTSFTTLLSSLSAHQWRIIILRGIAGGLTCIALYASIDYIEPGNAEAIYFMSPALVLAMSHIFLHEHATLVDAILAIVSISGAVIVSTSSGEQLESSSANRLIGALFAVIGAFLNATGLVLVRSIVTSTHFMLLVLSLGMCSIPMTLLVGGLVTPAQVMDEWRGPAFALACAVFAFIAQTLMHWGLKYTRVGTGSLIRNLEVPFVFVLAIILLNERPTLKSIVGSLLVIGSAVVIGLRQLFRFSSWTPLLQLTEWNLCYVNKKYKVGVTQAMPNFGDNVMKLQIESASVRQS